MRYGTIVRFDDRTDKRFGFVRVTGEVEQIFFHENDYRHPEAPRARSMKVPMKDDRIAFTVANGHGGRQKAKRWAYATEVPPRFKKGEELIVDLEDIPWINPHSVQADDCYACDFNSENYGNWIVVVFRESTGELFRVECHEGETGSEQPEIPGKGPIPTGISIRRR
ncbi:MAG: hypothetical protein WC052_00785 [Patescibacteria group bacterium]